MLLQAYHVGYTSPRDNLAVVQRLLDTRQEIAELLGAPSYAHYQAGRDTLAQHPAAITTFLKGDCQAHVMAAQIHLKRASESKSCWP